MRRSRRADDDATIVPSSGCAIASPLFIGRSLTMETLNQTARRAIAAAIPALLLAACGTTPIYPVAPPPPPIAQAPPPAPGSIIGHGGRAAQQRGARHLRRLLRRPDARHAEVSAPGGGALRNRRLGAGAGERGQGALRRRAAQRGHPADRLVGLRHPRGLFLYRSAPCRLFPHRPRESAAGRERPRRLCDPGSRSPSPPARASRSP